MAYDPAAGKKQLICVYSTLIASFRQKVETEVIKSTSQSIKTCFWYKRSFYHLRESEVTTIHLCRINLLDEMKLKDSMRFLFAEAVHAVSNPHF